MLRCPKCHRFGAKYTINGIWKCIWSGCEWKGSLEEIENAEHPIRFKKFADAIKKKMSICG